MTLITRRMLAEQIDARLAGSISDAALAAWAFDRFYAEELGTAQYEAGAEEQLAEALDQLMFADDDAFRLDDEELRSLAARLHAP